MESSSLQNGNGRGRRHKEEDEVVPTSPSKPPSVPRRVVRAPKCPRCVSPRENRRKREPTCHISENWRLVEGSHRQVLAIKQGANFSGLAQRCPGPARRWAATAPGWRLSGAWHWRPVASGAVSVSPSASCWYICSSPRYSGSLICLDFWSKASNLQKRHKKLGLVVYLDQCNP